MPASRHLPHPPGDVQSYNRALVHFNRGCRAVLLDTLRRVYYRWSKAATTPVITVQDEPTPRPHPQPHPLPPRPAPLLTNSKNNPNLIPLGNKNRNYNASASPPSTSSTSSSSALGKNANKTGGIRAPQPRRITPNAVPVVALVPAPDLDHLVYIRTVVIRTLARCHRHARTVELYAHKGNQPVKPPRWRRLQARMGRLARTTGLLARELDNMG